MDEQARVEAEVVVEQVAAAELLTRQEKKEVAEVIAGVAVTGHLTQAVAERVDGAAPHVREAFVQAMAACGVTPAYLAERLKEGLNATGREGEAAHGIRHKFLKTAMEALGVDKPPAEVTSKRLVYRSRIRGEVRDVVVERADER